MNKLEIQGFETRKLFSIDTINFLAYYHYSSNFVFNGEFHDTWELVYVDLGEVIITAGTETYTMSEKHFFLHPHNEFHAIRANNCNCKVFTISFLCSKGEEYLQPFCHGVNKITNEQLYVLRNMFDEYRNYFDKKNVFLRTPDLEQLQIDERIALHVICNYLETFFIVHIRNMEHKFVPKSEVNNSDELIAIIISYLQENLNNHVYLDTLSHDLGYSQSYLSKIFHKATGKSITSYLIDMRIRKAQELLVNKKLSIQEITSQTGFSSLQYFSKIFKQKTGYSPTDFRKSIEIHQRYDFDNY